MNPFETLDALSGSAGEHARVLVIEDQDLDLRIGVFEEEKRGPQRVRVSVEILIAPRDPRHDDDIGKVVSYAPIHDAIAVLADRPHVALQETLAEEIARLCLAPPEAQAVRVYVRKLDVYADCGAVGVRIVRQKRRASNADRQEG